MNKFTMYGIGIFAIFFAIFFVYAIYTYSRIFWCETVRFSNFNEIGQNVFIENTIENSESRRLLILVNQAKSRIENKFGMMISNPLIIVVDSQHTPGKYGLGPGRQTVRAYVTPWRKYLAISSSTQDINVLAHEYFHTEIAERTGYLIFKTKLPVWLDEGLAMQVDYRERYKIDNQSFDPIETDRVKTLNRSDFFTGDNEQTTRNIRAASAAVYEKLNQDSSASLYDLFTTIRKGQDIADVFNSKKVPPG